jgi:hypothetical protein
LIAYLKASLEAMYAPSQGSFTMTQRAFPLVFFELLSLARSLILPIELLTSGFEPLAKRARAASGSSLELADDEDEDEEQSVDEDETVSGTQLSSASASDSLPTHSQRSGSTPTPPLVTQLLPRRVSLTSLASVPEEASQRSSVTLDAGHDDDEAALGSAVVMQLSDDDDDDDDGKSKGEPLELHQVQAVVCTDGDVLLAATKAKVCSA